MSVMRFSGRRMRHHPRNVGGVLSELFSPIRQQGLVQMTDEYVSRCSWATTDLYREYHDREWGVPVHDDDRLFEMLVLEGMQAGLSWLTILNKREAFRRAFDGLDCRKVARYDEAKVEELMGDRGIVRNRSKILAAVNNAQRFIEVQEEYGSFDAFIWSYVGGGPVLNRFESEEDVPASTPLSDRISKDLKSRGFRFVGSTIVYSFMQATGMVNDHVRGCHLFRE